jgi:putative membrane protein
MLGKTPILKGISFGLGSVAFLVGITLGCPKASSHGGEGDSHFVANAASGGMVEVQLGHLAEARGNSPDVKNFGRRMVADHSDAGAKLQAVASKEGMSVSSTLNQEDQATYNKLRNLSGADFDRAYADAMVKDHEQDIAEFEREAKSGKDSAVRQFAQDTLPTLREHLKLAQAMQKSVGGAAVAQ